MLLKACVKHNLKVSFSRNRDKHVANCTQHQPLTQQAAFYLMVPLGFLCSFCYG